MMVISVRVQDSYILGGYLNRNTEFGLKLSICAELVTCGVDLSLVNIFFVSIYMMMWLFSLSPVLQV